MDAGGGGAGGAGVGVGDGGGDAGGTGGGLGATERGTLAGNRNDAAWPSETTWRRSSSRRPDAFEGTVQAHVTPLPESVVVPRVKARPGTCARQVAVVVAVGSDRRFPRLSRLSGKSTTNT